MGRESFRNSIWKEFIHKRWILDGQPMSLKDVEKVVSEAAYNAWGSVLDEEIAQFIARGSIERIEGGIDDRIPTWRDYISYLTGNTSVVARQRFRTSTESPSNSG